MTFEVEAKTISNKTFTFECPFCWSRYKKNGQPYKTAKRVIHTHGSSGDLSNRREHRQGHCHLKDTDFHIHITDNTKRI